VLQKAPGPKISVKNTNNITDDGNRAQQHDERAGGDDGQCVRHDVVTIRVGR